MIIKRTRGVDAGKALAYDYGPGKAMEHHNPRRVAGTVAGRDWRVRARTMQAKLREDGDTVRAPRGPRKRPAPGQKRTRGPAGSQGRVIRLAVSAAPEDRVMSDRDWSHIANRVVGEFTKGDADRYAWEAVRHDPRHIHITLLARGHDGKLISERHDQDRYGRISAGLERDYQLRRVEHSRTDTPERKHARAEGRQQAVAGQRSKSDQARQVVPPTELTRTNPPKERRSGKPSRDQPPAGAGQEPRNTAAPARGLRPPEWEQMDGDARREWYRREVAPHPERVRSFRAEARTWRVAQDRPPPSEPKPPARTTEGRQEPREGGLMGQWRADRLGPKPDDWDRWPPQRQSEHIRARMAEYQRRQREERRRGRGRDDEGRGRDDDR